MPPLPSRTPKSLHLSQISTNVVGFNGVFDCWLSTISTPIMRPWRERGMREHEKLCEFEAFLIEANLQRWLILNEREKVSMNAKSSQMTFRKRIQFLNKVFCAKWKSSSPMTMISERIHIQFLMAISSSPLKLLSAAERRRWFGLNFSLSPHQQLVLLSRVNRFPRSLTLFDAERV